MGGGGGGGEGGETGISAATKSELNSGVVKNMAIGNDTSVGKAVFALGTSKGSKTTLGYYCIVLYCTVLY